MKRVVLIFLAALMTLSIYGCDDKKIKKTGAFQSMYVEDSVEYVEILVDEKIEKYITRIGTLEYAAIPDFLSKGMEIGFYYSNNKDAKGYVIERFISPHQ